VWGVYRISNGDMSVGALVAVTILAGRTMAPVAQAAGLYVRYQQAKHALEGLNRIMQLETERPDGKAYVHVNNLKGDIKFRDVNFIYPGSPLESLHQTSLHIKPKEKVAIVGRSGSGKTTILKLMINLYNPTAGSILLDDLEIRQLDVAEVRDNIAYVPQNVVLFKGTLRENILMANPGADDAAFQQAVMASGVNSFAKRHPMGFDMPVGEGGSGLSGGQRQAVAMARAFVKGAPIMIMDEPTSEMDNNAEAAVIAHLKETNKNQTLILVTHRASLLQLVDRIIVMDYGKVVADGPRDKVIAELQKGLKAGKGGSDE